VPELEILGVNFGDSAPWQVLGVPFGAVEKLWLLGIVLVVVTYIAARRIVRARPGLALSMVRESEVAASSMGVDVGRYKAGAFFVAAVYAGIAGVLLAVTVQFITPQAFGFMLSTDYLVIIIIGGLGSLRGAIAGAVFVTALPRLLGQFAGNIPFLVPVGQGGIDANVMSVFVYCGLLILVIMFARGGLDRVLGWIAGPQRRPRPAPGPGAGTEAGEGDRLMYTWLHVLDWRATSDPDALAMSDDQDRLTYRQFRDRVEESAASWYALGVRSEDVVAVLAHNGTEFLVQTLGLIRLGAVPLLVNWRMTAHEIDRLLEITTPVGIFADEACRHLVGDRRDLVRVVAGPGGDGWTAAGSVAAPPAPYPYDRLRSDQVAFLMHTSGTTGLPKVIPLDHGSLVRGLAGFAIDIGDQQRGSRHLVMMPLFHLAGFAQAMQCFLTGGTLFIHDGVELDRVIDTIARDRIEFFTAAPTIIEMLVDAMEGPRRGEDLSSLREVQYGAAPIDSELLERSLRVVCRRFRQIYGSTELQGFLTVLRPEDHVPGSPRLGSAGRVSQGWEARIVGPAGSPQPDGEAGELWVRSENIIREYWRNPEETRAAFTDEGWYRTGDVAVHDEDGFLHIVGRSKDMIISGGENVYPAEIERVLLDHPAVTDVAVVARPHPKWGETPVAFVVCAPGADPDDGELARHCRERLAGFKCPSSIELIAELPRNALGKVRKVELRERLATGLV
uniref:AMP-binding protein n=2 Tax=Prescottella defluvii TaxID=1323361 RepID=UPI0012E02AD0